ncbi:MAG: response regulator [Vicinamibacterales bacterium]|jgi:CheY-like chemotaxis protein|nr:response regulator [Vicinamibacterales bacterium]
MMKVLLAEDEPDVQLIARLSLKKAGFNVVTVSSGIEVLERVTEERPDAILLDWMMPDMDGYETCKRLKADPATASIPVIFLTARVQEAEVARAMALGAVGCIGKPFDALALGRQVLDLLERV